MDFVVGSGPAGVACAQALAQTDRKVVVLDAGITLATDRREVKSKLAATSPSEWSRDDLAFLKGAAPKHPGGKLAYGSDFVYRAATGATKVVSTGADARGSYAVAGLSNVWGSAVLPYRQNDLDGWPVTAGELAPHYASVLKWMPVASHCDCDHLEQFFPSFLDEYVALPQSRQAKRLLRTLSRNHATLKASGVFFGPSRLAVDALGARSTMACQACGQCLHGCPYDLIYSTNGTLNDMITAGRIEHRPGVTVQRVEETEEGVRIHGFTTEGACLFEGKRVFLGAGALNTTAILLRSLGWYGRTLQMKDSQFFQLPTLHLHHTPHVEDERLHTLCQVFIEIFDEGLSPYTIHLQIYTYNQIFREELAARLGPLTTLFPKTLVLGRLILLQGLLHSSQSGWIDVTLRGGDEEFVELVGIGNPVSKHCAQGIAAKLLQLARSTGLLPMTPMLNLARPGGGFHYGGTFPMARVPSQEQSDRFGRPAGLKRVYVVDSTVFPSIPATTITLTVMANAHRIGTNAEDA